MIFDFETFEHGYPLKDGIKQDGIKQDGTKSTMIRNSIAIHPQGDISKLRQTARASDEVYA